MVLVGKVFDLSFNLRRIIDVYSSFIWNEYYIGYGDFELRFPMDDSALDYIKEGWFIGIDQSDKLMFIEYIGVETDVQNGNYAVVKGRSLESMLLRRYINADTIMTGNFQTAIMGLVQANLTNAEDSRRMINRVTFTPSTDPRIKSLTVDAEYQRGDNLYDIVNGLCTYELVGFKITPNWEDTSFEMTLYKGVDHSYAQNERPWVVFSSKYENLKSSNMTIDTRELKNAALVENPYTLQKQVTDSNGNISTVTEERLLVVEVGEDLTGFDRREIFMTTNYKPTEVDKAQFGRAKDMVNIRDYQEYMVVSFDSRAYKEACQKVNDKYNSRIQTKGTVHEWVASDSHTGFGWLVGKVTGSISIKDGYKWTGGGTPPGIGGKSRSAEPDSASISPLAFDKPAWKPGGGSSNPGDPSNKPDWLKNTWHQVDRPMTPQELAKANAKTYAAWEKAMPDKRDFEVWGWDFPSAAKRHEYEAAVVAAQAEIDKKYEAALAKEEELTKDAMRTAALIELQPYLTITNFDGEVDSNVQFLYGRDYFMGDVVQIVNPFNFQATTRVVSMLLSEEEGEGFKAIPTFESDDPSEVEM